MGSGHEILEVHRCSMGEAAAICSRSMISFLSSTTGHGWNPTAVVEWMGGFWLTKTLKKKQIFGEKNGNTPKYQKKEPRIISFTYLMSFKLGSSMVPHGKQFSSTHCLGPIQGLISMADAGSRDKKKIWLVVEPYPSEKTWSESQLGWLFHSLLNGKSHKIPWFQSPPTSQ